MKLRIPLPRYTASSYSIVDDEYRGGWRFLFIAVECVRHPKIHYGPVTGFQFGFRIGFGVKFSPADMTVRG